MKFKTKDKIKAIQANTAEEFENQFNDIIDEYSISDYKVDISDGKFFAIIQYKEESYIAETIAEEYELRGETFRCGNCPECHPRPEGNTKKCDCKYADIGITRKDSPACEWFYKQLSQGKLKPKEFPLRYNTP